MTTQPADSLQLRSSMVLLGGRFMPATVALSNGRVVETDIGEDADWPLPAGPEIIDVGRSLIVPAPIDIHFHGGGGVAAPPDASCRDLADALTKTAFVGTGIDVTVPYRYLATLPIPSRPPADVVQQVAAAATAILASENHGCEGIRLEGCFLNPDRAGVWPPETFLAPSIALLDELIMAAQGQLKIIDVAPELPGALELIAHATASGLTVSLAHSDATFAQAKAAINAGASLATHTFNAMRSFHHREPGIVGAVLTDPRVTCELICDGVHLHPATVDLVLSAKTFQSKMNRLTDSVQAVCISDASPFAGLPSGQYNWHGIDVTSDGTTLTDTDGHLAGSASLLPAMFRWLESALAAPQSLENRWRMLTVRGNQIVDLQHSDGVSIGNGVWIIR